MTLSILTAVYNRASTLPDALDSLAAQINGDFEHVVQDGGSTDGSVALIEARADARTKLVSERDGGIYDALNRATARATGDAIGLLHSDDYFAHPDVLAQVAAKFAEADADAVYGDLDYVAADNTDRIIRHWKSGAYTPAKLRRGWMPPHPALFVRREVIERWGAYDTQYRIAADYDAMLRYLTGGMRVAYIPEVLVKMRVGGESNRSLSKILQKSREDYRAIRANQVGGLGTLLFKNTSKIRQFF